MSKVRFVGLDVHAETIAVAVAEPTGEVRSLGGIANRPDAVRRLMKTLGPAEHLREFGIDVLVDAPGVGSNLDDHVEGLVMWEASRPMVTRSTQCTGKGSRVTHGVPASRSAR